jgi:hypothetical protein
VLIQLLTTNVPGVSGLSLPRSDLLVNQNSYPVTVISWSRAVTLAPFAVVLAAA